MILLERRVVLPLLLTFCFFTILTLRFLLNDDAHGWKGLLDDEQLVTLQGIDRGSALVSGDRLASTLHLSSTSVPSTKLSTSSKDASSKLDPSRPQTTINLTPGDWSPPSPLLDSDRFLSYTAHSGFHNQR